MRPTISGYRALLALLAVGAMVARVMGVAVPAGILPGGAAQAEAAAFVAQAGGTICHGDGGDGEAPHDHDGHGHDCVLCPVCLGAGFVRVGAASVRAAPAVVAAVDFVVPAVGAVPGLSRFATARPRGPPVRV